MSGAQKAERDLYSIGLRIGERDPRIPQRFLTAVEKACELLADMPELGSRCESSHPALSDLRLWVIRRYPNYVILYRPTTEGIDVLRVFHGAQQIEELFPAEGGSS